MTDTNDLQSESRADRLRLSRFLLVSSYAAGFIGMGIFHIDIFRQLTPFNLLLSFGILMWNHEPRNRAWLGYVVVAWLIGYVVEVVGVATGLLFGQYAYGSVLGWKVLETPLLIGINWAMTIYLCCDVANRLIPAQTKLLYRLLWCALLPVALDVLIEPVAIDTGMWHWYGQMPPLQNYIGWYVLSFCLCLLYQKSIGSQHRNPVALLLLVLQFAFFLLMNLV
ncbi:MAG: carotenoid biosynthesis protein [Saprospiraceae bacterium]